MSERIKIGGVDVTEHVARMFDALVGALGWGSGFLDVEDAEALVTIAELAGFETPMVDDHFDPPGLAQFKAEPFPESARMPEGGWPSDRPEVWERAQADLRAHGERHKARCDEHARARAEALRAWREQVQARARALRGPGRASE